jgi:hypothetical protein
MSGGGKLPQNLGVTLKIKKHIQLLTITHPRYEKFVAENEFSMEEHLELLDKVVIEKAVEERVGAGRRHSKHVKEGESNHQGFCNIFAYPSNCNTTFCCTNLYHQSGQRAQ